MYGVLFCWLMAWTVTILGCRKAAAALASRSKRCIAAESSARSGRRILIATVRSRFFFVGLEDQAHTAATDDAEDLVGAKFSQIMWIVGANQNTLADQGVDSGRDRAEVAE